MDLLLFLVFLLLLSLLFRVETFEKLDLFGLYLVVICSLVSNIGTR